MAVTIDRFDHTLKKLLNAEIDPTDLYLMLLSASATFDATNTAIGDVSANEVSGNGWTAGGEALANAAWTVVTTDDAKLDADDITVTASGGAIGPARYAAVYELTSGDLLFWIDFGEAKTADEFTDFKVVFNASGIMQVTD